MRPAALAAVMPPLSRPGMAALGWEACDVIIVTGDAYVDHPSFGSAVIARVLLDAGFRVGVIAQPRWSGPEDFCSLGRPRLFFGVTAGNVDSLVANQSPTRRAGGRTTSRPAAGRAGAPTARQLSTAIACAKPTKTCHSSSAASRPACVGSRTTTTGRLGPPLAPARHARRHPALRHGGAGRSGGGPPPLLSRP